MLEVQEYLGNLVKNRISVKVNNDEIESALVLSLSAFNAVPTITYFKFEDTETLYLLSDILVTYAAYVILVKAACSDIENAMVITNIANNLWNQWNSQVKDIKESDSFYEDFVDE